MKSVIREYDPSDAISIFGYSSRLLHNTLANVVKYFDDVESVKELDQAGKGGLGVLVEKYFFGYEPNNDPRPDFPEAGVELKVSPLKKNKNGDLTIKERLVCDMIDYMAIVGEEFEDSRFYKKATLILVLFYLHISGCPKKDLEFIYSVLWKLKDKDLLIIKQDFLTIRQKVRDGKAHELSEGDTLYLGACRKGQKDQAPRLQPFSEIKANARAFSFKPAYMRTLLDYVRNSGSNMATNLTSAEMPGIELVTFQDLQSSTFDDILKRRFAHYIGKDYKQIANELGIKVKKEEKSKYATIVRNILAKGVNKADDIEEIKKAGIKIKTIRIQKNGRIREHMSFSQIDYQEFIEVDDWIDSTWYDIITTKYMFVIFREVDSDWTSESRYVLDKMFFWTMPTADYKLAEEYWSNIKENVVNDTLTDEENSFWKLKDHKNFHVRPKAVNTQDTTISPISGKSVPKKSYWFDNRYLMDKIKESYGLEWDKVFKTK